MIDRLELVPVTETSHPFAHAAIKCRLDEHGYLEDEYFMHGVANVYDENDKGEAFTIFNDAPYVNRMLVRRPADIGRFSGNVVIEILNPSAYYDIDRMWAEAWRYFVRHGDIYIGITSKTEVFDTLHCIDHRRYSRIDWRNPLPDRPMPKVTTYWPPMPQYENGLFWDMLTDLACALRTDSPINPIAAYGKPYVFLTGWSQSGGYMVRYKESFSRKASDRLGAPIFDGYLEAGASSVGAPINSFQEGAFSPRINRENFSGYIESDVPYIAMNTETETWHTRWRGDSDLPDRKFRVYEIAGSTHDSQYNLQDYYKEDEDPEKVGRDQPFPGIEPHPQDYPYEYVYSAGFRNLFIWAREGMPAPTSQKIERDSSGECKKDALGNTKGGIRTPFIDYPTCVYYKWCTLKADGNRREFWGHVEPYSPDLLRELYGTLSHYKELVAACTDENICKGYLLPGDREDIITQAVGFAKERGLE